MFCLAKPPVENVSPSCFLYGPRRGEAALSLWPLTLFTWPHGEKKNTQPISDNILFCCICCLFVHFNNSYKIKKHLNAWFAVWLCCESFRKKLLNKVSTRVRLMYEFTDVIENGVCINRWKSSTLKLIAMKFFHRLMFPRGLIIINHTNFGIPLTFSL